MKVAFALLCLFAFLAPLVFGDDAEVLPQGVVRLRLIPSFTTVSQSYDNSGSASDLSPGFTLWTASGALEYGLIKGIGIGAQWAPGDTLTTDLINVPNGYTDKPKFTGLADLQLGAKIQVLGSDGFIHNDQFRIALTPGIAIPLDNYDAKAEAADFLNGEAYRPGSSSSHQSLGFGLKGDLDWIIVPSFFINLHGQISQYLEADKLSFLTAVTNASTALGSNQATADSVEPMTTTKYTYGLEYVGEIEPRYQLDLTKEDNIQFALPVTLTTTPQITEVYNETTTTLDPTYTVLLRPYVDAFLMLGPLPLEFQAEYDIPVAGKNSTGSLTFAESTFVAQVKLYYQF